GRVLWANAAQLRLLGYSAEEYVGYQIREFYVSQRRFDEFWQELMAHQSVYDFEVELRCKTGSTKHVLIHSSGHWENGEFLYTRCFMRDISEHVRLEEELQKTIAQLAAADRRKDEFLAVLGHELRNPLGAVQNAIAAARLGQSRRDEMLEIAWRQTEQLGRLVGDLLDIARITQGKIRLQKEPLRIGLVIERGVEQARELIASRRQELSISLAPEADAAQIYGDPARLQQIVGNLVHNAAKFTQPGGRINLTADRKGDEIFIRVSDNGPGLSSELLARAFDLFAQADTSLARVQGGLGIGLTIVKKLVEMHGGRIQAKSEGVGKGSQFEVWFPMMTDTPQAEHPIERPQSLNRSRVLVVEDNYDAAESLKLVLQLYGHDVTLAANGLEAVDAMRVSDYDVALVDIGLPDIDGYEVARRIRALHKSKPMVLAALTGYGQQRDKQMALAAGFDHHFMKPVDIGELHAFLSTLSS
ncbi:MAG TPA: ATP-binding protein, partial [Candidatus Binataceae bacterium]|nr:ATP-binding protein [Candidatus Binataceae bacterium]